MTANELREQIASKANEQGLGFVFPKTMEVDADTFGHICNEIFKNKAENAQPFYGFNFINIALGDNNGVMFRNIELILKGD